MFSMKSKLTLALLLCALLTLVSCESEPLPQDKRDYAGVWQSSTVYLYIGTDGRIEYLHQEDGRKTSINGPIKKFVGDDFEVGILAFTTTFVVSKKPHLEDGVWKMTVDERELIKAPEKTIQPK